MELRLCNACRKTRPGQTVCPVCAAPLTLTDHGFFLGARFGKYLLESVLGEGGMGVVYGAVHETLGRRAALKILVPAHEDPLFARRFLQEARILAELKHPNIVEIYDFDVSDWDTPYYVMEALSGASLRRLIDRRADLLELHDYSGVLRDLAAGLGFAHRSGVVHRDLKPGNIFVELYEDRTVGTD